jgi:hypothetical protein
MFHAARIKRGRLTCAVVPPRRHRAPCRSRVIDRTLAEAPERDTGTVADGPSPADQCLRGRRLRTILRPPRLNLLSRLSAYAFDLTRGAVHRPPL